MLAQKLVEPVLPDLQPAALRLKVLPCPAVDLGRPDVGLDLQLLKLS